MNVTVIFLDTSISPAEQQAYLLAQNHQLAHHFNPAWNTNAVCTLGDKAKPPATGPVVFIQHDIDVKGALGYHSEHLKNDQPFAIVSTDLAKQAGDPWTTVASHEVLELIGNPDVTLFCPGPHPDALQRRTVFYWHEMCDAVQSQHYDALGVKVSNFVLPEYFRQGQGLIANKTNYSGWPMNPFHVAPGGYMGYFDPKTGNIEQIFADKDAEARFARKAAALGEGSRIGRGKRRHALLQKLVDIVT